MTRGRGGGAEGGFGLLRGKGAVREAASLRVISKGGSEEREVGLLGLEITGEIRKVASPRGSGEKEVGSLRGSGEKEVGSLRGSGEREVT